MIIEKPKGKALAVIKLELLSVLMLFLSFLKIFVPIEAIIALETVLAALFLFFLFTETRKLFARDFTAYAIFFLFLFAIILANLFSQLLPITETMLRFQVFFAMAIAFLVFLLLFRVFFVRNVVSGKIVSSEKGTAIVETDFDLPAMVNAGRYTVKARKKFEKGKTVKLKVKQALFGRKPAEIIE